MERLDNDCFWALFERIYFISFTILKCFLNIRSLRKGALVKLFKFMRRNAKIYAKEQQIELIDNILCSLCSIELNTDGRKYLKKIKEKIQKDVDLLKHQEKERSRKFVGNSYLKFRFGLPDSQSFQ